MADEKKTKKVTQRRGDAEKTTAPTFVLSAGEPGHLQALIGLLGADSPVVREWELHLDAVAAAAVTEESAENAG